jgi:putative FmdB family regulatory protein
MPIYEYGCKDCRLKTTVFLRSFSTDQETLVCDSCGSSNLVRLFSRVAIVRSEESRLEDMTDPSNLSGIDENDPKSVAKFMRKMQGQIGEDVSPEIDEAIERMEQGEMPEEMACDSGMGELE